MGMRLTTGFQEIVQININPVLKNIKTSFAKWKMFNLSLWGEINTVKMMVSSKIKYIILMITLKLPVLVQYNKVVKDYLWNRMKPQMSLIKMFPTRGRGGLTLPNTELFSIALEMVETTQTLVGDWSHLGWMEVEKLLTSPF